MNKTKLILCLFIVAFTCFGKKPTVDLYANIDKKALQLPDSLTRSVKKIASYITSNFQNDNEKVRAVFVWIAANIEYDAANMFAINFYEPDSEKIAKPLRTRKGICENYAALFNAICSKAGIESFVIEGYTKQNGFADYIPHVWCTAWIDSAWFAFDPTWGSGYISGGKFYKKINNDYYKVSPAAIIKSHMPFDYLWQFLNYPVTNQEFYEGRTQQDKSKPYFSYPDSIEFYQKQDHVEQMKSSAYRIEKNGVKNSLIFDRLQHIKREIEYERQTVAVDKFNSAVVDFNDGINYFNDFINYRNKQFTPMKSDAQIQSMIDIPDEKFKSASKKISEIKEPDANTINLSVQMVKSIADAESHLKEQQDWLKVYFTKNKSGRKSMFYDKKITWFGVPLTK